MDSPSGWLSVPTDRLDSLTDWFRSGGLAEDSRTDTPHEHAPTPILVGRLGRRRQRGPADRCWWATGGEGSRGACPRRSFSARGAEAVGCSFSPWQKGTERTGVDASDTESFDWATEEPLDVVRRIRDHLQSGPASEFAADTAAAIEDFEPDVVAPDSQIFGVDHRRGGGGPPGRRPGAEPLDGPESGHGGSASRSSSSTGCMKAGLPDLNAARAEHGLPPLDDFYDQLLGVDRILVLTSETFDDAAPFLPDNVRYVGPVLDDPVWTEPGRRRGPRATRILWCWWASATSTRTKVPCCSG